METAAVDILELIADEVDHACALQSLSSTNRRLRSILSRKVFQRGIAITDENIASFCDPTCFEELMHIPVVEYARSIRLGVKEWSDFYLVKIPMEERVRVVNENLRRLVRRIKGLREVLFQHGFPIFKETFECLRSTHKDIELIDLDFSFNDINLQEDYIKGLWPEAGFKPGFLTTLSLAAGFKNLKSLSIKLNDGDVSSEDVLAAVKIIADSPLLETLEVTSRDDFFDSNMGFFKDLIEAYSKLSNKTSRILTQRNIRRLLLHGFVELPEAATPGSIDTFESLFNTFSIEELHLCTGIHVISRNYGMDRIISATAPYCLMPNLRRITIKECFLEFHKLLRTVARSESFPAHFMSEIKMSCCRRYASGHSLCVQLERELQTVIAEEKVDVWPKKLDFTVDGKTLLEYLTSTRRKDGEVFDSYFISFMKAIRGLESLSIWFALWGNYTDWRPIFHDLLHDLPRAKQLDFPDLQIPPKDFNEFSTTIIRKFPALNYIRIRNGIFQLPLNLRAGNNLSVTAEPSTSRLIEVEPASLLASTFPEAKGVTFSIPNTTACWKEIEAERKWEEKYKVDRETNERLKEEGGTRDEFVVRCEHEVDGWG